MNSHKLIRGLVALSLALAPIAAVAHPAVVRSVPAKDATLVTAPVELRLTFNEAVELAFTTLSLEDAHGQAIPLGILVRSADSTRIVFASISTTLPNGKYKVKWRTAGKDGHAVRGEYSFVVAVVQVEALSATTATTEAATSFDASSPVYAAIRWIRYSSLLALIGAGVFVLVVLRRVRMASISSSTELCSGAAARAERIARWAVGMLLGSSALRLMAQVVALNDPTALSDPGKYITVVRRTTWGNAWLLEVGVALCLAWVLSRGRPAWRWPAVAMAAPILALASAFSGHAVAVVQRTALALGVDALHVLAASAWIGSLFSLVFAGIPAGRALGDEAAEPAVRALVEAFSPTALVAACLLGLSGTLTAWLHFGSLRDLWMSAFGRTLLVKLGVLSFVAATGAYNWRAVLPSLGRAGGRSRLQKSATLELVIAAVVVAVTAVLVATPTPMEGAP